jgi:hypothetical protein
MGEVDDAADYEDIEAEAEKYFRGTVDYRDTRQRSAATRGEYGRGASDEDSWTRYDIGRGDGSMTSLLVLYPIAN